MNQHRKMRILINRPITICLMLLCASAMASVQGIHAAT
jgi:hypothetical protein